MPGSSMSRASPPSHIERETKGGRLGWVAHAELPRHTPRRGLLRHCLNTVTVTAGSEVESAWLENETPRSCPREPFLSLS